MATRWVGHWLLQQVLITVVLDQHLMLELTRLPKALSLLAITMWLAILRQIWPLLLHHWLWLRLTRPVYMDLWQWFLSPPSQHQPLVWWEAYVMEIMSVAQPFSITAIKWFQERLMLERMRMQFLLLMLLVLARQITTSPMLLLIWELIKQHCLSLQLQMVSLFLKQISLVALLIVVV